MEHEAVTLVAQACPNWAVESKISEHKTAFSQMFSATGISIDPALCENWDRAKRAGKQRHRRAQRKSTWQPRS